MIKNIIFDWSGVVKDCVDDQLLIVNKIFQDFGADSISLSEFKENWVQPYMAFYNKYLPELTLEEEQAAYKKAIMSRPAAHAYPGIVEAIKKLKDKGIRMVVVSSDFSETIYSEINLFSLQDIFIDIVTDVEDKLISMKELMTKHNFDKADTIVIGDSNHEVEAGKAIGIKTMGVTWGFTNEDRMMTASPDFIAHSTEELMRCLEI